MNNTTQAGKRLDRLRLDPDFRRLWYIAYKDKSRLEECINEARRLFNLSPIWGSAYLPIIFSECPTDLIQINLNIPQPVEEKIDRHYAVAQNILRQYGVERPPATPLVEYSRYVLRSGSETEKTAFANGITNKVAVKNGVLKIS